MLKVRAKNINVTQHSPLDTPPGSPIPQVTVQNPPPDVMHLAELFKEMIAAVKAASAGPHASTTDFFESSDKETPRERVSRLEVKSVFELNAILLCKVG
jgi:hypothetical protein